MAQIKQLHSAQDAIEQAIEGGYLSKGFEVDVHSDGDVYISIDGGDFEIHGTTVNFFTDPLFWQAFGKARGFVPTFSDTSVVVWRYWAQEWFQVKMTSGDETKFWESLP